MELNFIFSNRLVLFQRFINKLVQITKDGIITHCFDLPGIKQEGITIDPERYLYIADDNGNAIFKPKNR